MLESPLKAQFDCDELDRDPLLTKLKNEIAAVLTGCVGPEQQEIARTGMEWIDLLLAKNADYGSTIFEPPKLAQGLSVTAAILTRMSDKIDRLVNLSSKDRTPKVNESFDDTIKDLGAYCLLYLVSKKLQTRQTEVEASGSDERPTHKNG